MSRLPSGYQELTYIESTGTQYINTMVSVTSDTIFEVDFMSKSSSENAHGYTSNGGRMAAGAKEGYIFSSIGASNFAIKSLSGVSRHTAILNASAKTANVDGIVNTTGSFTNYSNGHIFLCARSSNWNSPYDIAETFFIGNLYSAKIYRGNSIYANFVPCKRKSDSVIGMYDLVSNTFFGNAGTGTFIAGTPVLDPIVPTWGSGLASVNKSAIIRRRGLIGSKRSRLPAEYQEVEFIESTGTQSLTIGSWIVNYDIETELSLTTLSGWIILGPSRGYNGIVYVSDINGVICLIKLQSHKKYYYGPLTSNTFYKVRVPESSFYINGVECPYISDSNGAASENFILFNGAKVKMKIVTRKYNGTLINNLIPCYRKSDNKSGMYDLVTGIFHTDTNGGNFVVGADV